MLKTERDALAVVGLLAHNYMTFDPPIGTSGGQTTHFFGFNVHCAVVDNSDGEVLALERNAIHDGENPLQHAEQRAIRAAIERLRSKRPRSASETVESYYKERLLSAPGAETDGFTTLGCTLYNTYDPCAMCAVTSLIAYVQRVAYLFDDEKFSNVYDDTKSKYFATRRSIKERVATDPAASAFLAKASDLHGRATNEVEKRLRDRVQLVHALDGCPELLAEAAELLRTLSPLDLATEGDERSRNVRTLTDFQRRCGIPNVSS